MTARASSLRPTKAWAAVTPWTMAPWLPSVRRTKAEAIAFLSQHVDGDWKMMGFTVVRVTVVAVQTGAKRRSDASVAVSR